MGGEPSKKAKSVLLIDPDLLKELSKVGRNINQIAKHLNLDRSMSLEKKVKYFTELATIEQSLDDFLKTFSEIKEKLELVL